MTETSRKRNKQRVITIHDEKEQIVDFPLSNLPVPATNILDSPTRCYEANIEWSQIIEGHLLWLAQSGAWKDAQEDDYPAIEAILTFIRGREDGCGDGGSKLADCYRMDTTTEVFSYYPNDPFSPDPDDLTLLSGLRFARFSEPSVQDTDAVKLIADTFNEIIGYRDTDVFVTPRLLPDDIPPIRSLDDWLSILKGVAMPFPYVRVDFEGAGQLEIELLNIPFGGGAVLIPDTEFTLLDIGNAIQTFITGGGLPAGWLSVDLDRDIISFPPSLIVSKTIEFEFETDEPHFMHIVFHPKFDDEFPFFKFLGGIREMEFCGNIQAVGQQTGTLYDKIRSATDAQRIGALGMVVDQDMCDSIKCAILDLMSATMLGLQQDNVRGGIDVQYGKTGLIEINIDESVREALEVVPDVPADDVLYGGLLQVEIGMNKFYGEILQAHADNLSISDTVDYLANRYTLEETNLTAIITAIFGELDIPNSIFDDWTGLADFMYCENQHRDDIAGFAFQTAPSNERPIAIGAAALITLEQFDAWYLRGRKAPDAGYITTPCYRLPTQTKEITPDDILNSGSTAFSSSPTLNLFDDYPVPTSNARYAIRSFGAITNNTLGRKLNLFYRQNATLQYVTNDVRARIGGNNVNFEDYPANFTSGDMTGYFVVVGTGQVDGVNMIGINGFDEGWDIDTHDIVGSITIQLLHFGQDS